MTTSGRIFICYRRTETEDAAQALFQRLNRDFPGVVFMDVNDIAPGERWDRAIDKAVESCDVIVPVIGRNWLEIKDRTGGRALENDNDPVRREISAALAGPAKVMPVLVQGATMPAIEDLPTPLRDLALYNAIELHHNFWEAGTSKLVDSIKRILVEPPVADVHAPPREAESPPVADVPAPPRDAGSPRQPLQESEPTPPQPTQESAPPSPRVPIPTYLAQAIAVTVFCCIPAGIAAIVYASQVNGKVAAGDIEGAMRSSKNAKKWCWVAVAVGGVILAIWFLAVVGSKG